MSRLVTRVLLVPIGIGFAALAALVVALAGSLASGLGESLAKFVAATGLSVVAAAVGGADPNDVATFLMLLWAVMAAILLAPITLVALAGEAFGARSWLFYAFGMGGAFAAVPVLFPGNREDRGWPDNAGLGFLATGIAAGTAYWLVAGRGASAPVDQSGSLQGATEPRKGQSDAGLHGPQR